MRYAKPQSVLMQCRRAEVRMRTLKLIGRCQRIHSRDKLSAISVDRFTCRALEPRLWDIFSYVFFRLFVWWFVICVLKNKFIQTHNLHIFPSSSSLIVCQTDILTSSHDSQFWLFGYDFSTYTMRIRTILGTNPFHESLERKKNGKWKINNTRNTAFAQKCVKSTSISATRMWSNVCHVQCVASIASPPSSNCSHLKNFKYHPIIIELSFTRTFFICTFGRSRRCIEMSK